MDKLLGKVAESAGVKSDPGESFEQTMKEEALERAMRDKVEGIAGAKVADSKQAESIYEKVADAVGDKVPTSMLAAGAMGSMDKDEKSGGGSGGSGGAADLMGAAASMFGGK